MGFPFSTWVHLPRALSDGLQCVRLLECLFFDPLPSINISPCTDCGVKSEVDGLLQIYCLHGQVWQTSGKISLDYLSCLGVVLSKHPSSCAVSQFQVLSTEEMVQMSSPQSVCFSFEQVMSLYLYRTIWKQPELIQSARQLRQAKWKITK